MLPLLDQLTLRPSGATRFVAPASQEQHLRAFGGQLVAQSLMAAGSTVDDVRSCHSLHAYFLHPGAVDDEFTIDVEIIRDGRSFSMREARSFQRDRLLFLLTASFHSPEVGSSHSAVMPEITPPEALPTFAERYGDRRDRDMARWFARMQSFDVRHVGPSAFDSAASPATQPQRSSVWFRFTDALPERALVHQAVAAYASDFSILDPILLTHGRTWTESTVMGASLDHAMWFHRPIDANAWMLFDHSTTTAGDGRGLATANVWSREGSLLATVTQEALLRPPSQR